MFAIEVCTQEVSFAFAFSFFNKIFVFQLKQKKNQKILFDQLANKTTLFKEQVVVVSFSNRML